MTARDDDEPDWVEFEDTIPMTEEEFRKWEMGQWKRKPDNRETER